MPIFEKRTRMPVSAQALYDWHAREGAFERLNPPFAPVEVLERSGGLEVGARTVLRMSIGPTRHRWVAVHTACEPGRLFRDEQQEGPFAKWVHTHRFEPRGEHESELVDHLEYELPLGALGQLFGGGSAARTLEQTFAYRHAVTRADLVRHAEWAARPRKTFAISGASGLVAGALIPFLTTGGHRVQAITRKGEVPDGAALDGADVVVNLAGAGIADARWTEARKRELIDSRVAYTRALIDAASSRRPAVWIQGSAIGVYGDRGDEVLTEQSAPGPQGDTAARFLSKLCVDWEAAAAPVRGWGGRLIHLRTGLVQTAQGGALKKMLPAFQLGAGGPIASGKAWQSWISLEDLIGIIYACAMRDELEGPVDGTAPHPVDATEYARTLGHVLHRPSIAPLPAFALRTMFGEMADGALLTSTRALPEKLTTAGFRFLHPTLEDALRFTLGR